MNMTITSLVTFIAAIVIGGVGVILACVGSLCIVVYIWQRLSLWIARPHLEKERKRTKKRVARDRQTAEQREEALLRGASVVATRMVKTVVRAQLQFSALREDEHQRREALLLTALATGHADQSFNLESSEPVEINARAIQNNSAHKSPLYSRIAMLQTVRNWLPRGKGA